MNKLIDFRPLTLLDIRHTSLLDLISVNRNFLDFHSTYRHAELRNDKTYGFQSTSRYIFFEKILEVTVV
ncbi:hypothetical protein U8527_01385 [Kordia algicida OT-1]|uniref:hypothetical protein n=1 Tax=Kordia algicida TaxID=221066 RepID=UPI0002E177C0|nr:hypothetical protein [Kordia algicida]